MPKFDLDSYEPVEKRIASFYAKHPKGSILTELQKHSDEFSKIVFMAVCFNDDGDPIATGWAMETQDTELKKGRNGEYESVNYSSWLENAETSAIGRALANMGLHGNKRPSREEMEKVERATKYERPPESGDQPPMFDSDEAKRIAADMKAALAEMETKGVDKPVIEGYRADGAALWKDKKLGALADLVQKMRHEADLEVF